MAYCTISDVNSYVPQSTFTATTTPTQAQVMGYAEQMAVHIDSTLENIGYVVPVVSGVRALVELRKANAWAALGLAQQSRITAIAPDQAVGVSVWTKMFNHWLEALASPNNPFELDAPRNSRQVIKPAGEIQSDMTSSSVDSGTSTDPTGYLSAPTFKIGMPF